LFAVDCTGHSTYGSVALFGHVSCGHILGRQTDFSQNGVSKFRPRFLCVVFPLRFIEVLWLDFVPGRFWTPSAFMFRGEDLKKQLVPDRRFRFACSRVGCFGVVFFFCCVFLFFFFFFVWCWCLFCALFFKFFFPFFEITVGWTFVGLSFCLPVQFLFATSFYTLWPLA